jgi:hypothetical protein
VHRGARVAPDDRRSCALGIGENRCVLRASLLALVLAGCAPRPTTPEPAPDPRVACETSDDCRLVPEGCGACGQPTFDDVVAVHRDHTGEVRSSDLVCPRCHLSSSDWRLQARCHEHRCEVVDLRTDTAIRGCAIDADCSGRAATCGAPEGDARILLVGTGGHAAFEATFCPTGATPASRAPVELPGVVCRDGLCSLAADDDAT